MSKWRMNLETGCVEHLFVLALVTCLAGCAASVNVRSFQEHPPKTIGLAVGHDISAVSSLSPGQEVLVSFSFGLLGIALAEATAKTWSLHFADQVNEIMQERAVKQLERKGYVVQVLAAKPEKWALMENVTDAESVYPNLRNRYDIPGYPPNLDAILFIEYLIEGRLEGRLGVEAKVDDLTVQNMKLKYAKSKIWLYDTRTGKRLYFDSAQRGYPSFSSTTVSEAVDTIVNLEAVPMATR